MDEFIRFGSAEACSLMNYVGATQTYQNTCIGGYKSADAYFQAGVIYWGCISLLAAAFFIILRKSIAHAFA